MHLCLCLPLFVVLGPFWAVFNFAHLEIFINSHGRGGYEDKIVILSLVDYSVSWIPLENSVIGARATALDRFSAYYTFLNKRNEVVTNVISFTFCE